MNTKPLTLTEVSKLIDELDPIAASDDDRIQNFISAVERAGKEILQQREKENVGKYCSDASEFLTAAVLSECLTSNAKEDMSIARAILKNTEAFQLLIGYAFIYSVGLCAIEELR